MYSIYTGSNPAQSDSHDSAHIHYLRCVFSYLGRIIPYENYHPYTWQEPFCDVFLFWQR